METVAKVVNRAFSGGLAVLLLAILAPAAMAQTGSEAANCLDESLGTVHETRADNCDGRLVSDEEAASLRRQRQDYIQKVLTRPAFPQVKGKRLVGLGSGFFVARDGSVVTSNHVVDHCDAVSITPTFGEMRLVDTVTSDPKTDLALLRANIAPPRVAPIFTGDSLSGLGSAYVIGYPNRGLVTIEPILTAVEIIGRQSDTQKGPAIVVRGDIRQGNSGGPLLDSGGSVLGVVFAKIDSVNVYQTTGQVVREIGLALPGKILESFLTSQGVGFQAAHGRPPQSADRILEDARPFLVQVGCWK